MSSDKCPDIRPPEIEIELEKESEIKIEQDVGKTAKELKLPHPRRSGLQPKAAAIGLIKHPPAPAEQASGFNTENII